MALPHPFENQEQADATVVARPLLALAAGVALLYYGRAFFITLVVAGIIAFILDPFVAFLIRFRTPRGLASFLVCSIALLIVYLTGLGLYTQVSGLVEELPAYSQQINELVDSVVVYMEKMEKSVSDVVIPRRFREREQELEQQRQLLLQQQQQQAAAAQRRRRPTEPLIPPLIQEVRVRSDKTPVADFLYGYASSFYNLLLMASFVPFLVYFMLSWRDHMRRAYLQLFHGTDRLVAGKSWEGIAAMARAYVVGNFILGLLLAGFSSAFFVVIRLPYPLLIGPLSGFLSLVPYAGLPLAMLPPLIAALTVYRQLAWFVVIAATVGFLHLLALNLLYPKLVGSRVHLNPLVVTVALMFWGAIWGGAGLVLAIPITAGVKAVCDNVSRLQPYGKLLGD